jgi:hypothetical protein
MNSPSEAGKNFGMSLVLANESSEWKRQFLTCAANYLRRNPYATCEDIRMYMTCSGYKQPHHVNTWGAMWNAVTRKDDWVRKTSMSRSLIFPDSHARMSFIWESLMYLSPDAPIVEVYEL